MILKGGDYMNERIKEVRKTLGKTQDEFSKKIGLSRNFIAQVEIGTKVPSERTINDICRIFSVNEEWLRTGEGEMFKPKTKDEQIAELLGDIQSTGEENFKHKLVSALAKLNDSDWDTLEKLVDSIADK